MSISKFVAGIIFATVTVILIVTRIAFEVLGASTAPDDFALLKERMPVAANWLFTTPWWVPTLLMIGLACAAGWLLWNATTKTTEKEIEAHPHPTLDQVLEIIEQRIASLPPTPLPCVMPPPKELPTPEPPAYVMEAAKYIIALERNALAEKTLRQLSVAREAQSATPNEPVRFGGLTSPLRHVMSDLRLLGITEKMSRTERDRIELEIKADVKYMVVGPNENFKNGESKRSFYSDRMLLDSYITMLQPLAKKPAAATLLANFNLTNAN